MPAIVGGGAALLVLIVIVVLKFSGGSPSATPDGGPSTGKFCNNPISGSTVIYAIDRGNSIANDFDELKLVVAESIRSLGPDRKFAVVLWNNGRDDMAFPNEGLRNATSDQITQLHRQIDPVQAGGASRLRGALERALSRHPDSVVIVTSKPKLDDDDNAALASASDNSKVKIYSFVVNAENSVLKMTAKPTGGDYRSITSNDLHDAAK